MNPQVLPLLFFISLVGVKSSAVPSKEISRPETGANLQPGKPAQVSERSRQIMQDRINQEMREAEKVAKSKSVNEAISAIEEVQVAVKYLGDKSTDKANSALERAIGKLDLVLAKEPGLALLPILTEVSIRDFIADSKTVKAVVKAAQSRMDAGEIQKSRRILMPFASEITQTSVSLPTATYPIAIRAAARLLSEGKAGEAKTELQIALDSLVRTERSVPLPIVRAQALIDEVNRQIKENKVNKSEANLLLDDADTQLNLAEDFGYGTRKQEFSDLANRLKQIKKNLNDDKDNKALLTRLVDDLKNLKEKIF